MNLSISPVKFNNNIYNRTTKTNKISFEGKKDQKVERDLRRILDEATFGLLAVTVIGGGAYNHSLQKQQEQQIRMLNSISQKLNHPEIFEVDTVFADKDGKINIVLNNKVNGKVYNYDLINSRQYIEYPPEGKGIMHDYKNGKDYIKYEGRYVPAEEVDNK